MPHLMICHQPVGARLSTDGRVERDGLWIEPSRAARTRALGRHASPWSLLMSAAARPGRDRARAQGGVPSTTSRCSPSGRRTRCRPAALSHLRRRRPAVADALERAVKGARLAGHAIGSSRGRRTRPPDAHLPCLSTSPGVGRRRAVADARRHARRAGADHQRRRRLRRAPAASRSSSSSTASCDSSSTCVAKRARLQISSRLLQLATRYPSRTRDPSRRILRCHRALRARRTAVCWRWPRRRPRRSRRCPT